MPETALAATASPAARPSHGVSWGEAFRVFGLKAPVLAAIG